MSDPKIVNKKQYDEIKLNIRNAISEIANICSETIDDDIGLGQLGFNSLHYTILSAQLGDMLNKEISPVSLFDLPTLNHLVDFAIKELDKFDSISLDKIEPDSQSCSLNGISIPSKMMLKNDIYKDSLAIIGTHCRMPKANNLELYWQNLIDGRDCIDKIPMSRWSWEQIYGHNGNTSKANEGGFIDDIYEFDAAFFKLSPREAELMDPKQRLLLQGVWHTLENSGYKPSDLRGKNIGVFIGSTGDEYTNLLIQGMHKVDSFTLTGSGRSFISNRINYVFDWSGPSETIDTTCSSSLVALHNAQRAISNGDCSMAIIGGINLLMDPYTQISLSKVNVLAEDCRCKTFDSRADGYVRSEGLGLVLVKPYNKAIEDNDHIYAIIRGSSVNHGGHSSSLTAPNAKAQSNLIQKAYKDYEVDIDGLGYCEAHGTGTQLGDPIEIEGLKQAISSIAIEQGDIQLMPKSISVGSAKTNIGHCEAAAGIAGLLKITMCLKERLIPPLVHLDTVNSKINLENSPLYFSKKLQSWSIPSFKDITRKAAISSFGFGGVNAHVIVEEYKKFPSKVTAKILFLPISAKNEEQLFEYVRLIKDSVEKIDETELANLLYTFQIGREQFNKRVLFLASEKQQLIQALHSFYNGDISFLIKEKISNGDYSIYGEKRCFEQKGVINIVKCWLDKTETIELSDLYEGNPKRIPAPVYPFAKKTFLPKVLLESHYNKIGYSLYRLEQNKLQLILSSKHGYVRDHVINNQKVLPSAAYISFIEDIAYNHLGLRGIISICNMVWYKPILFLSDFPVEINIEIEKINSSNKSISFYTLQDDIKIKNCSADIKCYPDTISSEKLSDGTKEFDNSMSDIDIYTKFNEIGIVFGESLKIIKQIWFSENEALSEIKGKEEVMIDQSSISLKITAIDSVLQTSILHQCYVLPQQLCIPFSIDKILINGPVEKTMYARVFRVKKQANELAKYNILAFDKSGSLLMEINGCTGLAIRLEKEEDHHTELQQATKFVEVWEKVELKADNAFYLDQKFFGFGADDKEQSLAFMLDVPFINILNYDNPSSLINTSSITNLYKDTKKINVLNIVVNANRLTLEQALNWQKRLYFWTQKWIKSKVKQKVSFNIIIMYEKETEASSLLKAIDAFGKVVSHEFPLISVKTIIIQSDKNFDLNTVSSDIKRKIELISYQTVSTSFQIRLDRQEIYTLTLKNCGDIGNKNNDWKIEPSKVYLITGGMGRVGKFVGTYISNLGAKVVLMGSSSLDELSFENRQLLSYKSKNWEYKQINVTNKKSVFEIVSYARNKYGAIGGVIHCAGTPPNSLIINKKEEDYERIVRGKVLGAYYFDEATKLDDLSLFLVSSSLVSITGHVGCTDYAFANRVLERFTEYRSSLVKQGLRSGMNICIAWPAWKDGMNISHKELEFIKTKGFIPLEDDTALNILKSITENSNLGIYFLACGNKLEYEKFLNSFYIF